MALPADEIFRFVVVGIAATAVHYFVLSVGVELAGIDPVMMTSMAFVCAAVVTYTGQSLWVFQARRHRKARLARFSVSVLAGLVGNVAIMAVAVNLLRLDYTVGFVSGLILVPAATYLLNRTWVFS